MTNFTWEPMGKIYQNYVVFLCSRGRRDHDCMVVGFTTIYAISAYHL